MRCPKCGYISFDHLETCKKCRKGAIAQVSGEISGTVYDSIAPNFLVFEQGEETEAAPEESAEAAVEVDELLVDEADGDDFILSLGAEEEAEEELVIAAEGEDEEAEEADDIVLSLDELEEAPVREEFTLDLGGDEQESEEEGPTFDFSELDISDLMPPGEPEEPRETVPEVALEVEQELGTATSLEPKEERDAAGGLEDLLLDELELDTVSAVSAGKEAVSPVKTGTALDNFDVDLGELFKEDE